MDTASKSRSRRKQGVTEFSRQLRHGDNMGEALLWNQLKAKNLGGFKFVRQFPIGPYFADFICRSKKLVVEVDGSQHFECDKDRTRDHFMNSAGFIVARFWINDILKNMDGVCQTIFAILEHRIGENIISSDLRVMFPKPMLESAAKSPSPSAALTPLPHCVGREENENQTS
jgi:very-short-patch-repair endonuclease